MKYIPGIIALLLIAVFAACEDETKTCDQTLLADLGINFKKDSLDGYINKDTTWPKVTVCALDKDTLISQQARSSVYFELDPLHDTCRYYLKLDSTAVADTLTFRYTRTPHFVSAGCGFATFSTLDTVITTYHTIDSLHINNREVTSDNTTNISLFFIY
ncbi:DUF6452 family protein [[Flexibacter] sp. ATCC 35208]|uniref:DUF6452 family protein n=1 Tax=[Flexibacter] sp. ATCC 35208 TaxID=1936242 RepID=UPI0009D57F96|nr:DUF6452 family protein [[Flexibacter] sp. ATCC 35208]OMP77654.1 hypothetical protein BW716_19005 [[Flexibacter] sp. ATCC 35208]